MRTPHAFEVLMAFVGSLAWPQEVIRSYLDPWPNAPPTGSIAWLDDVDGDSWGEVVFANIHQSVDGITSAGRVAVLSGRDGVELFSFAGTIERQELGSGTRVMDLTGDGIQELIASSGRLDESYVWDVVNHQEIARLRWYSSVLAVGDVNTDSIGDALLCRFAFFGTGECTLYHGGTFEERYTISAPPGAVHFGQAVTDLGDVSGDGIPDFAVGAPGGGLDIICVPGEVYVYSGVDGQLLYRLEGEGLNSAFGVQVASPGDFDGDGIRDLVVAADFCCCDFGCFFGCDRPGRLYFFEGQTGTQLGTFDLPVSFAFGRFMIPLGDVDGNGFGDLLVSFQRNNTQNFVVIDGGTRAPVYVLLDPYRCSAFGAGIAPAKDADADGFPDFILSSTCRSHSPRSRIDLFSGAPVGVRSLGQPCGADGPRIGVTGVPRVGRTIPLHVSEVEPGLPALLFVGTASAVGPLPLLGARACAFAFRPQQVHRTKTKAVRPGEGVASVLVKLPPDVATVGARVYAQWHVRSARGWSATRVLELEIQPLERGE